MAVPWHKDAKRMRAEGVSLAEIARRLGYSAVAVSYAVNDDTKRKMKLTDSRWKSKRAIRKKPVSLPSVTCT